MTIELATEDGAVCADYAAHSEGYYLDFAGYDISEFTQGVLDRYINGRLYPGSFMEAVLCNDLKKAVSSADTENMNKIPEYVRWLYNRAPSACWGSIADYERWLYKKN